MADLENKEEIIDDINDETRVKEDDTDPVTILASASGDVSALTGLNTKFSEKRFVKATGNGAGMKAKVVIEYI